MEQQEEQSPFSPGSSSEPQNSPEPAPEPSEEADAPVPAGEPTLDAATNAPATAEAAPAAFADPNSAEPDAGGEGEFKDKVIVCAQCGAEFIHTASAQAFYREKGFANEPKRCAPCRKARKSHGGGGGGGGGGGFGGRGAGGPRQMYPATCADCGKETEVPFKPSGARPVYCLDCYRKQRGD